MSEVLAKVGGIEITDADVDAFIESLPQEQKHYATNPHFRNRCKEQLIDNHCLALCGEEQKLDETEEFKALMARVRKDILSQMVINAVMKEIAVTDEETKAFYEQNQSRFQRGESVSAKHILVDDETLCLDLLAKINAGEMDFESAAKEFSTCPSKERGGDLGQFGRGQMVPEFDSAAFEAEVGQVVGPVKTQFGYHLIKVEQKNEAAVMAFEEVAENIKNNLFQQKQNEAYAAKVNELRAKYMQ